MLHIALKVYSYSGGVVAPENTTFLATAAGVAYGTKE